MASITTEQVLGSMNKLGLFKLGRFANKQKLLVLTYHSVVDVEHQIIRNYPFLYRNAVTIKQFRRQLTFLHKNYTLIDPTTLLESLRGLYPLPERAAFITFDDGLRNNSVVAAPVLDEFCIPATFFLPTAFLDEVNEPRLHWTETLGARLFTEPQTMFPTLQSAIPEVLHDQRPQEAIIRESISFLRTLPVAEREERLQPLSLDSVDHRTFPAGSDGLSVLETMTWEDARSLPACVTLGSHSHSHASLSNIPLDDAYRELLTSKQRIEEKTQRDCVLLAYPFGSHTDVSADLFPLVEKAGYMAAFTQFPGFNELSENPFSLKRINVPSVPSIQMFQYHTSGLYGWRRNLSFR